MQNLDAMKQFRAQRGQGMVEYTVITAALVAALFTPNALFNGQTGAAYLAEQVKAFYRNFSHFISLP